MQTMRQTTDPYYQSSGRAPLFGVLLALILGLAAGMGMAFAYAYLLIYIPIAGYITFLLSAGFGFCTAFVTAFGLSVGKVRSHAVTVIVVSIVALVSFYTSWVAWVFALLSKGGVTVSLVDLATPGELWRLITFINEVGAWSMFGGTPKGVLLWVLWTVEAGIIFGSIVVFSGILAPPDPFCEECNDWCEDFEGIAILNAPTDPSAMEDDRLRLIRHLEGKDFRVLEELGPPQAEMVYYRIDETVCEQCKQTCLISLNHVVLEVDEDGDVSDDATPLMSNLVVSYDELLAVRELGDRMQQTTSEETPDADAAETWGDDPPPPGA